MNTQINGINLQDSSSKWLLVKLTDNIKRMLQPIMSFMDWYDEVCEVTVLHEKFDVEYNKVNDLLLKSERSTSFTMDESESFVQDILDLVEISLEIEMYSYEEQLWPMIRKMNDLLRRINSHLSVNNKKVIILQLQYALSQFAVDYEWWWRYLRVFNNDI